ncbi:MAG: zinc ribbon domain-containing protein [Deltaproteobacteria bacterium]|nr:zinc ribbon domain-containing protein [Deltaproteobacteria bacterium]
MVCPKCSFEQAEENKECLRCGIVFEKYMRKPDQGYMQGKPVRKICHGENGTAGSLDYSETHILKRILFHIDEQINPVYFAGRVMAFFIILACGVRMILTPIESIYSVCTFIHLVNLPFHEAGHILFRLFGAFITSLGGSLGQLLMPLICTAAFLLKTRDTFGASIALWWFGENFLDIAPYINDANRLVLPLLGGNTGQTAPYGFHDWEYILTEAGIVDHAQAIAGASFAIGSAIMLVSFSWAGYILYQQYRHLQR